MPLSLLAHPPSILAVPASLVKSKYRSDSVFGGGILAPVD